MGSSNDDKAEVISIVFCVFSLLLAGVLLLSKALHSRPKLNTYLSEPAMVLIVGMLFSFLLAMDFGDVDKEFEQLGDDYSGAATDTDEEVAVANSMLSFSPNIFYMALLPPILYNSGYELERDLFMRHIKPIVLFAAIGTAISAFATGFLLYGVQIMGWLGDFNPSLLELLTFGALIAATDTVSVLGVLKAKRVDPHLFSLVFGESALNDGVAIVLFKTLADMLEAADKAASPLEAAKTFFYDFLYEAIGSPILGILFSFIAALIFKYADLRKQKMIELSFYMLLMYVPFVLAEISHLSGIVTIFFSGMSARRYIEPNVTESTKENSKVIFKLAAYIAETCIFLQLGLSIFGFSGHFKWEFIGFAFIAALLGRAVAIYPLSFLFNLSLLEVVEEPLLEDDDVSVETVSTTSTGSSRHSQRSSRRKKRRTPEKRKDKKIPTNFMHLLWFAGLRGAVAYACAQNFPDVNGNDEAFLAATMIIVLVTIIFMGGATEPLIQYLEIKIDVDEKEYMREWRSLRTLKGCFHSFERKYMLKVALRDYKKAKKNQSPSNPYIIDSGEASQCYDGKQVSVQGGERSVRSADRSKDLESPGEIILVNRVISKLGFDDDSTHEGGLSGNGCGVVRDDLSTGSSKSGKKLKGKKIDVTEEYISQLYAAANFSETGVECDYVHVNPVVAPGADDLSQPSIAQHDALSTPSNYWTSTPTDTTSGTLHPDGPVGLNSIQPSTEVSPSELPSHLQSQADTPLYAVAQYSSEINVSRQESTYTPPNPSYIVPNTPSATGVATGSSGAASMPPGQVMPQPTSLDQNAFNIAGNVGAQAQEPQAEPCSAVQAENPFDSEKYTSQYTSSTSATGSSAENKVSSHQERMSSASAVSMGTTTGPLDVDKYSSVLYTSKSFPDGGTNSTA